MLTDDEDRRLLSGRGYLAKVAPPCELSRGGAFFLASRAASARRGAITPRRLEDI